MPSSISSSNARLPALRWGVVLGGATLIFLSFVGGLELRLALRGFQPTVLDTEARWIQQRARASALGARALILVGSSRIQLDADLDLLRSLTGLEPVQLAVDGGNFRPVLEGLSADAAVRGTVVVDFSDHLLTDTNQDGASYAGQRAIERTKAGGALPDFDRTERWLSDAWRQRLRSYADGAQPLSSLIERILSARAEQYLVTLPDRSRLADFTKVDIPRHYLGRVLRILGPDGPASTDGLSGAELAYLTTSRTIAAQAAAIRKRGGRAFFVMLPKSGLIREIDDRRFPRALFWDRFTAEVRTPTVHFLDVAAWRHLDCPDGSHLDLRQREAFTRGLVDALGLARAR